MRGGAGGEAAGHKTPIVGMFPAGCPTAARVQATAEPPRSAINVRRLDVPFLGEAPVCFI